MGPPLSPGLSPRSPGSDGFDSQQHCRFLRTAPTRGWLKIVGVLFTIGQTLPSFPASIGTPYGYPLLRVAI